MKSATTSRISTTSGGRFAATSIGRSTASTSRSAGRYEALFDALDGFDQLAEQFHNLTKDLNDTARATRELLAIIPENIAVSKAIRDTTLTIYSSFDSLIDQFDRLTDTNAVMGKSFNDSRVESLFYLPPEIFQNSDFQFGLSLMVSPDGKAARFIITHAVDPATTEGIASVDQERQAAKEALKLTSLENADIYLGGTAATFYDIANGAKYDLMIAAVASIVLIFIIMVIVTRALVAAGVIVGTIVMSLGAAFGFSTLIWQHLGNFQLHWVATEFALIVLLAVGSDYNLMLVSRIEEEIGAGLKTGLIRGMGVTGPVVTAAGVVFAVTMGTMITSDLRAIGQFGTTIGIGLLFDTFVVRIAHHAVDHDGDGTLVLVAEAGTGPPGQPDASVRRAAPAGSCTVVPAAARGPAGSTDVASGTARARRLRIVARS